MNRKGSTLSVAEVFLTIAGETTEAGRPAVFVRLAGCNLACNWCDTAWAREPGLNLPIDHILEIVNRTSPGLVVVTGGEPLVQAGTSELCKALLDIGKEVIIETNGSIDTRGLPPGVRVILDLKAPTSGVTQEMNLDNLKRLKPGDELKVVIANRGDFDWLVDLLHEQPVPVGVPLLLSPAGGQLDPACLANWLLENPLEARLQVQLHRFIWPDGKDGIPLDLDPDPGAAP